MAPTRARAEVVVEVMVGLVHDVTTVADPRAGVVAGHPHRYTCVARNHDPLLVPAGPYDVHDLLGSRLPGGLPLQPNEYYELWFVKGDKRISCGGFAVDSEGRATVTMNAAKAAYVGYSYAVVTREKASGDLRTSESRVLGGEIKKT